MQYSGIEEITNFLKKLDTEGEFSDALSDEKRWQELLKSENKTVMETLGYLSEFGELKQVTDKINDFIKQASENSVTYQQVREPIQKLAKVEIEEMLAIYAIGESLFFKGEFEKAASISSFLSCLNPNISSFWRMTGFCYKKLGNQNAALPFFLYASMVNSLEIENHLASIGCLNQLGFSQEALNYYNSAKEVLSEAERWDDIKILDSSIAAA